MSTPSLDARLAERLRALASALIDQRSARILVPPQQPAPGFWFGGGNLVREPSGAFLLSGRYRNVGDSRTGLQAGERGLECALFRAETFDGRFQKVKAWSKADLSLPGAAVTSIEGTALRQTPAGIELYVSLEKAIPYPADVAAFQKPGTGVWSINRLRAATADALGPADNRPVLASDDPVALHVKDPVVADDGRGDLQLLFCEHPHTWSCSYTGWASSRAGSDALTVRDPYILPRGHVWDVAAARVTNRLRVPRLGVFRELPPLSLYFYDGAECVREHEQNARAVRRPRGYSCEEIGGLAWGWDDAFPALQSLTPLAPLFVSPHGTGCSRYVSTLTTEAALCATWQQSQPDRSQPLVGHALPMETVERLLGTGEA